jgi:hypothetical protein
MAFLELQHMDIGSLTEIDDLPIRQMVKNRSKGPNLFVSLYGIPLLYSTGACAFLYYNKI